MDKHKKMSMDIYYIYNTNQPTENWSLDWRVKQNIKINTLLYKCKYDSIKIVTITRH